MSRKVIKIALIVHSQLGPGLFEEVYKKCLKYELLKNGFSVLSEVKLPVSYDSIILDIGYRIDLLVENKLIVELKSVEQMNPLYKAQLLNYLKLSQIETGLLFNFNTQHLRQGITRVVNTKINCNR